jgi:ankyrin repeat protein
MNTVRYLLDRGANPNARDKDGFTPLHSAVLEGSTHFLLSVVCNSSKDKITRPATPLHQYRKLIIIKNKSNYANK